MVERRGSTVDIHALRHTFGIHALPWRHRPHEYLDGRTANEVYNGRPAANETSRIEPRPNWPPGAPCAAPAAAIDGEPGQKVVLLVSYHADRKHLPVIQLKRVA